MHYREYVSVTANSASKISFSNFITYPKVAFFHRFQVNMINFKHQHTF